MTPDTRIAIAKAIEEISALTTQEFRERLNTYREDPLARSLMSLAEFASLIEQCIEMSFSREEPHAHAADILEAWYDDIVLQCAANDDRYLLAA